MIIILSEDALHQKLARHIAKTSNIPHEPIRFLKEGCFEGQTPERLTIIGHANTKRYGGGGDHSRVYASPEEFFFTLKQHHLPQSVKILDLIGCEIGLVAGQTSFVDRLARLFSEHRKFGIRINAISTRHIQTIPILEQLVWYNSEAEQWVRRILPNTPEAKENAEKIAAQKKHVDEERKNAQESLGQLEKLCAEKLGKTLEDFRIPQNDDIDSDRFFNSLPREAKEQAQDLIEAYNTAQDHINQLNESIKELELQTYSYEYYGNDIRRIFDKAPEFQIEVRKEPIFMDRERGIYQATESQSPSSSNEKEKGEEEGGSEGPSLH